MQKEGLFLTGGTGMIGRDLVPLFIENTDYDIYILVHKKGLNEEKTEFIKTMFCLEPTEDIQKRINIINGDVTKKKFGLSDEIYENLIQKIKNIIHSAASTRFDLHIDDARQINVDGTKHVLDFAIACEKIHRFGFISTAYVAGKRTGLILEDYQDSISGFVNTYEQSKYEAEKLLLSYKSNLPIAVYRLSTVLGNSKTGEVTHFTAPHQALRIMYLGLAAMLPGSEDYKVDLIPSDYASWVIFEMFSKKFSPTIYHVVSGIKNSYSLKELIDRTYELFTIYEPEWELRKYPKPVIASSETFDLFLQSAEQTNNPLLFSVLKAMRHFAHQLSYPKEFDTMHTLETLPEYIHKLPDVKEYYEKVVSFCLQTKWGKISYDHGE